MSMSATVGEYRTQDGCSLKYRCWPADSQTDALIYLHGIESHSEWFAECARHISGMGIGVYALDRRGSGMNSMERGHCSSYRRLLLDVLDFACGISGRHDRLHCAGLSWGGKLAAAVASAYPALFASLTLIAPGIFPRVAPAPGEKARIAFDALFRPRALHPIPIKDAMFTSMPERLAYIANDPLRLRRVTASFYRESFKIDRLLRKRNYQWKTPTQVLLAEHDRIIDNEKLQTIFDSLEMEHKRILLYKGCNHSVQFERPGEVARDIVEWIGEVRQTDD
ncbi:MAG: alpha/beta fold hydrolase [Candidatus Abyssobacteria bacterium SURF_5]|uniref:Alpha/beta fold hydrolase n=1 Tax=Abyssobacteria bacterium (strain SURF_5) TaxID=2093360 RepID=A0A3A4NBZ9_ABYX5|nr:MAG: alpha/beta fold hydrolase [Candidatus Abyssubacteria bacterium SURF_5]